MERWSKAQRHRCSAAFVDLVAPFVVKRKSGRGCNYLITFGRYLEQPTLIVREAKKHVVILRSSTGRVELHNFDDFARLNHAACARSLEVGSATDPQGSPRLRHECKVLRELPEFSKPAHTHTDRTSTRLNSSH